MLSYFQVVSLDLLYLPSGPLGARLFLCLAHHTVLLGLSPSGPCSWRWRTSPLPCAQLPLLSNRAKSIMSLIYRSSDLVVCKALIIF